jgi:hypothetical protein
VGENVDIIYFLTVLIHEFVKRRKGMEKRSRVVLNDEQLVSHDHNEWILTQVVSRPPSRNDWTASERETKGL